MGTGIEKAIQEAAEDFRLRSKQEQINGEGLWSNAYILDKIESMEPAKSMKPVMKIMPSKYNPNQYLIYYGKHTKGKYKPDGSPAKNYWKTHKKNLDRVVAGLLKRQILEELHGKGR